VVGDATAGIDRADGGVPTAVGALTTPRRVTLKW
jgi:hypothetical protein